MRTVEIDWHDEAHVKVTWQQGMQPSKSRVFDSRDEAEFFAKNKMGARGCIISTLDMTAEQLAQLNARKARAAAIMAEVRP